MQDKAKAPRIRETLADCMSSVEISFPIEFVVYGTPVSLQAKRPEARTNWMAAVRTAAAPALPQSHFASEGRISVTLYYFPRDRMQGDVDNIVKAVLDALSRHIYMDDAQVERIVVQKFEPGHAFEFTQPTEVLTRAMTGPKPVLYVRVSDKPFEDLL